MSHFTLYYKTLSHIFSVGFHNQKLVQKTHFKRNVITSDDFERVSVSEIIAGMHQ